MRALTDSEILDIRKQLCNMFMNKQLCNMFMNKQLRFKTSFVNYDYTDDEICQACDDSLTEFMNSNFGSDWKENDQAQTFYESSACEIRVDAGNDAIELYHSMND